MKRRIKKLSRGQLSAVGVIIGLASRAEITFFDEPYLGLDAVARQIFYDRLLEDYTEHPRTVILSSHLIDEVSNLIEKVLVIDRGRIIMDEDTDAVRDRAANIVGDAAAVDAFVAGREVIHRESLGRVTSVTVLGALTASDRERLAAAGLEAAPVSLQQLIVRMTQHAAGRRVDEPDQPSTKEHCHEHFRSQRGSGPRPPAAGGANRTLSVVRMQLINKQTYIWIPLIILGGAFVLAMAIYAILAGSGVPGPFYGGGAQAPLWYFGIVGIQALTLTFPFSQAMSVTRREFYLGHAAHRGADLRHPRGDRGGRRAHRAARRTGGASTAGSSACPGSGRTARSARSCSTSSSRCCSS